MVIKNFADLTTKFPWIVTIGATTRFSSEDNLTKILESASNEYNDKCDTNWDRNTNPIPVLKEDGFWRFFWKIYDYQKQKAMGQKEEGNVGLQLTRAIRDIAGGKATVVSTSTNEEGPY